MVCKLTKPRAFRQRSFVFGEKAELSAEVGHGAGGGKRRERGRIILAIADEREFAANAGRVVTKVREQGDGPAALVHPIKGQMQVNARLRGACTVSVSHVNRPLDKNRRRTLCFTDVEGVVREPAQRVIGRSQFWHFLTNLLNQAPELRTTRGSVCTRCRIQEYGHAILQGVSDGAVFGDGSSHRLHTHDHLRPGGWSPGKNNWT